MEFPAWPKTPRLEHLPEVTVTEKIDGSNGLIQIEPIRKDDPSQVLGPVLRVVSSTESDEEFAVLAGSRSRWLGAASSEDNFGFAKWVAANAETLVRLLGKGKFYGEWHGAGIQRTYGLQDKRFALFTRPDRVELAPEIGLCRVPELLKTSMITMETLEQIKQDLIANGSRMYPGQIAEGIVIRFGNAWTGTLAKMVWDKDRRPGKQAA